MTAIIEKRDIRVVVYPESIWFLPKTTDAERARREQNLAEEVARSIRRHVDGVDSVEVKWDLVTLCSFCGYEYHATEVGMSLVECCQAAIDEYEAKHAEVTP